MSKAMEHVRYLVDVVGFRAPASEGERWASKYIAGVMEKLGIECQVEPFDSYKTFSYPLMIVWALSVLGGLLCCSHGFLGFLLVTLGAAAFAPGSALSGLGFPAVAPRALPERGWANPGKRAAYPPGARLCPLRHFQDRIVF